jgi:uncharacterized protein YhhL (DUF1145 family)
MQKPLFALLKALILVIYALALAALFGGWTSPWSAGVQTAAGWLLLVHAVELVFVLKHVRRYPGPLALSVLLTLLYGLLHWKPLADKTARTVRGRAPR